MSDGLRIDKWLWATRLFKTRSLASQACLGGHVKIEQAKAKPSRTIRPGDIVEVTQPDITRTVRVKELVGKRVGAKRVGDYLEDLTPASEYERQKNYWSSSPIQRERGAGRPTKKDRRETERFFGV